VSNLDFSIFKELGGRSEFDWLPERLIGTRLDRDEWLN
jgi:hypothetical protein